MLEHVVCHIAIHEVAEWFRYGRQLESDRVLEALSKLLRNFGLEKLTVTAVFLFLPMKI